MQRHYAHHRLNGGRDNATLSFLPGEMTPGERSLIQRARKLWTAIFMNPAWPSPPPVRTGMADSEHGGTGA